VKTSTEKQITKHIIKLTDGVQAVRLILDAVDLSDLLNTDAYLHAMRILIADVANELLDLDDAISAQKIMSS